MTSRAGNVDGLLRAVNPVPPSRAGHPALDGRARDDLTAILASAPHAEIAAHAAARPVSVRTAGWVRRAALVGGLAVVSAAGLVVGGVATGHDWLPGGRAVAYAATPRPLDYQPIGDASKGPALLKAIAARTGRLSDDTGTGRYSYVELRSWHLWTAVDGQRVTSEVVPQQTRTWRASDGSGRIETATLRASATSYRTEDYGPGELAALWPAGSLSSDDRTLAAQLASGHPATNGPAERLVAVQDAYQQMPLRPDVRAALLRYLARTPGLEVTGNVADRAGRLGLAFSLESDYSGLPTRYTLIIDPGNGRLLGSEEMLTRTAGKLNVPVPSVIGYTVYLEADYADELA